MTLSSIAIGLCQNGLFDSSEKFIFCEKLLIKVDTGQKVLKRIKKLMKLVEKVVNCAEKYQKFRQNNIEHFEIFNMCL